MRLADFIDENVGPLVSASEAFAGTLLPASSHLDAAALRDHMPMILAAVAKDLRTAQSVEERISKSFGLPAGAQAAPLADAQTHALLRAKAGFDISQLVAEYRALRASVIGLWFDSGKAGGPHLQDDLVRFNEAIDQAVAESVTHFSAEVDRWRHVFLGALGHDLRGPLNAILLTADLLFKMTADAPVGAQTSRLIRSGKRMKTLLDDLLDFSRGSLGLGVGIHRTEVDLAVACREEIELLRAALPDAEIGFRSDGITSGSFDASRVREALSNLVNNAARYGTQGAVVHVALHGDDSHLRLSVTNVGTPIDGDIGALFEPLKRGRPPEEHAERNNLGLGLFIVREIAKAHGGSIEAVSDAAATVFTLILPRR